MTPRLALGLLLVSLAMGSAPGLGCGGALPAGGAPAAGPPADAGPHGAPAHPHPAPGHHHQGPRPGEDRRLAEVARVHGGAGPWAVAGYRMGEHALHVLGLDRGSFDLEVVHHTPDRVQYACIADGAAAATGASVGKLNLTLAPATAEETRTVYRRRSTGQTIALRLTPGFVARFADVPRPRLAEAGREVIALPDDAIFERVP